MLFGEHNVRTECSSVEAGDAMVPRTRYAPGACLRGKGRTGGARLIRLPIAGRRSHEGRDSSTGETRTTSPGVVAAVLGAPVPAGVRSWDLTHSQAVSLGA